MTENRWYDERFIKCNNCKKELIVFPSLGQKYFKCKYCGTKIKNKEYYEWSKNGRNLERYRKL